MQITVDMGALYDALKAIQPAVGRHPVMPILGAVKMVPHQDSVTLWATDLDLTAATTIAAEVADGTPTVVPFKDLLATLPSTKKDRAGPIGMQTDEDRLTATNGHVAVLRTHPSEDFPALPDPQGDVTFDLDVEAVASVLPAACREDSRPILAGVLFDHDTVVATNSYVLFVCQTASPTPDRPLLFPAANLAAIVKGGGPVKVSAGSHYARFERSDGVTFHSRMIEGDYPNYKGLIPSAPAMRMMFNPTELQSALDDIKRLKLCCTTPVRFAEGSPIVVRTVEADRSSYERQIAGTCPTAVAFNPTYLRQTIDGGFNHLDLDDALHPAVTRRTDPAGRVHTHLIMPVRVTS